MGGLDGGKGLLSGLEVGKGSLGGLEEAKGSLGGLEVANCSLCALQVWNGLLVGLEYFNSKEHRFCTTSCHLELHFNMFLWSVAFIHGVPLSSADIVMAFNKIVSSV